MIKTEKEYTLAKSKLDTEFKNIEDLKTKMKSSGLNEEQIKLAIDPLHSFALKLKEEIEAYEKLI